MYVECILISRDRTVVDEQISRLMDKQNALSVKQVQNSQAYRSSIRANPKYTDPELSRQSVIRNQQLKNQLSKHKIQTVLVSPLKADLQTCYDLLGHQAISVVIVPELVPKINSVSSIVENNSAIIQKFKQQSQIKIQLHPEQNYTLKVRQEQNVHKSINDRVLEMQNTLEYETVDHYYERLKNFKNSLIKHIALTNKKLTIIAHREVLEFLTSTGYYEDYQLVNKVAFGFGQIKTQHIMIQGAQGQLQNKSIPFCSCS